MADDKLARLPQNALAERIDPQIVTTANPGPHWLRGARAIISHTPEIQTFIRQARSIGLTADEAVHGLAVRLNEGWGGEHADEARETAQYLWDEQGQLGDGIYITSTETGRVIAALAEQDIYTPAPVPREDGSMAQPLPRIRPELEAAITCWTFDSGREARIVQALAERAHQTDLLREEGDPRLLVATRAGRRHLVNELAKFDPKILLRASGGTSGAFLQHFELVAEDPERPEGVLDLIEGEVFSKSTMNVADMSTVNLHHNRAASLQGALVQGWVREVARQLSVAATRRFLGVEEVRQMDLTKAHLQDRSFWVCPPEAVRYLRRVDARVSLMPVPSAHVIGLSAKAGLLVVPEEFSAASREMFDRWEASSNLSFRLWIDWSKVLLLRISGIEHQAVLA